MEGASGSTVLIIEDERDVVDLLAINLRKASSPIAPAAILTPCRPERGDL
jgi:hypothetical protein